MKNKTRNLELSLEEAINIARQGEYSVAAPDPWFSTNTYNVYGHLGKLNIRLQRVWFPMAGLLGSPIYGIHIKKEDNTFLGSKVFSREMTFSRKVKQLYYEKLKVSLENKKRRQEKEQNERINYASKFLGEEYNLKS